MRTAELGQLLADQARYAIANIDSQDTTLKLKCLLLVLILVLLVINGTIYVNFIILGCWHCWVTL